MKKTVKLLVIAVIAALIGFGISACGEPSSGNLHVVVTENNLHVAVTDKVKTSSVAKIVGESLELTGDVYPANATNQTVVWGIVDDGGTGAEIFKGNKLIASSPGEVIVRATIANGIAAGQDYSKEFTITVDPIPEFGIRLNAASTVVFSSVIPHSVIVNNIGIQATGSLTVNLSGSNAGNFILSTTTISSIAAGGNASFTVVPGTGLPAGTYTADVTVYGNNGINASFKVSYIISFIDGLVEMIPVPGGTFELGKNLGTIHSDVTPVSTVTLAGFHIGKFLITQEQYLAVMGNNPSVFGNTRPPAVGETGIRRPVEYVNWYSAIVFCNRLSIMEGLSPAYSISGSTNPADWGSVPLWNYDNKWDAVEIVSGSNGYRLPTEAQWEYAAKGGNVHGNFTFPGSNNINAVAWHSDNSDTGQSYGRGTREVGGKEPNSLGIYDMSGNVSEWCWDWYSSYTSDAKTEPAGMSTGTERVLRGGGWGYSYYIYFNNLSCNSRNRYSPFIRDQSVGFRIVRP